MSGGNVTHTEFSYGDYPIFVDPQVKPSTFYIDEAGCIRCSSLGDLLRDLDANPAMLLDAIEKWEAV